MRVEGSYIRIGCAYHSLLGGGIFASSGIYEICGCPGSGKTQLW